MAVEAAEVAEMAYDATNIFAKILDGKIPSTKVWESKTVVAILDAFPVVKGHTLIVYKKKGYKSILDMGPKECSEFMNCVSYVARAVKHATGCDAVNVVSNLGEEAGQVVFHPHIHIIPRYKDEATPVCNMAPNKGPLDPADAEEMKTKMAESFEASKERLPKPVQLRQARFMDVVKIKPSQTGLNVKVKCLAEVEKTEDKPNHQVFSFADATGCFEFLLSQGAPDIPVPGETYEIRNFSINMSKTGFLRGSIDKWGKVHKVTEEDEKMTGDVDTENNVSKVEYELVKDNNNNTKGGSKKGKGKGKGKGKAKGKGKGKGRS